MTDDCAPWVNTTHDWGATVDRAHLDAIRAQPATYAPGGVSHLVLEVMAYVNDEAEALGCPGRALAIVHSDGSISVADDGRGTDTRRDQRGTVIKKPVMSTKDLRFFDTDPEVLLPDGHPRKGISVVAALSRWLTHTNRRESQAWTQRYEYGVPCTDLVPLAARGVTGTTVHFLADLDLVPAIGAAAPDAYLREEHAFPWLRVEVRKG